MTPRSRSAQPYAKKARRRSSDQQRRARRRWRAKTTQAQSETTSSVLTVGGSVLGALFGGRRAGALAKASTAARRIGRISKERADVGHAEADARSLGEQEAALESELAAEIAHLGAQFDPCNDCNRVGHRPAAQVGPGRRGHRAGVVRLNGRTEDSRMDDLVKELTRSSASIASRRRVASSRSCARDSRT